MNKKDSMWANIRDNLNLVLTIVAFLCGIVFDRTVVPVFLPVPNVTIGGDNILVEHGDTTFVIDRGEVTTIVEGDTISIDPSGLDEVLEQLQGLALELTVVRTGVDSLLGQPDHH